MEYDDSFETWLHDLEMKVDPCTFFPEFCTEKMMCSSSSSPLDVEISTKHQLTNQTLHHHQTETSYIDPLSFPYPDTSNNNLHVVDAEEKVLPAKKDYSIDYKIEFDHEVMNMGQSEGDKWHGSSKNTDLPLPQHISIERKRRRDLNQRFMALSKVVPSINNKKKKDRASILEQTVKYVNDLQERIKKLEEMKKKKVVESVVFLQSSLLSSSSSSLSCSTSSSSSNQNYYGSHQINNDNEGDYYYNTNYNGRRSLILPEDQEEIEVKVMEKSVLIRVQCENNNNDKKILPRLLSSISKLHLVILTINALPFGNRIDITIMAQMGVNCHLKTKDIVDHLRRALPYFI